MRAFVAGLRPLVPLAALVLAACTAAPIETTRDGGRLGSVRVIGPASGPTRALVVMASGDDGWGSPERDAARALAAAGALVVGVDLPTYLRNLAATGDGCHYVVSDLEDFAHQLERDAGTERYHTPILAGRGAGGTLAYAALAQSPAATIAGAAGPHDLPPLRTRVPLCPGAPAEPAPGGGFRYGAAPLPGWWTEADGDLAAAVRPRLDPLDPAPDAALGDLPVTILPAAQPGTLMAVVYSGDGGWRDLDKTIAEDFAARAIPVVGIDSLRYFWRRRDPDGLARDLTRILEWGAATWGTRHVLLLGYSFGADVLPFIVPRLPEAWQARVVTIALLGPGLRASFEFHVGLWLGADDGDGPEIPPELRRLDLARVLCVYGAEEEDSGCRSLDGTPAELVRTTGGHHFDGDYAALADRIVEAATRRLRAAPPP